MSRVKAFLKRKNIEISAKRYGIDALSAMAQGLFASLLMGTILATLGEQAGIELLVTIGGYAKAATGPAMAVAIGLALQAPPLVLFSLAAVGTAANASEVAGAGGPLAVLIVTIFAAEFGKAVSKETKIDILVTPFVTLFVGIGLALWWGPGIGFVASGVGNGSHCKCSWKRNHVGNGAATVFDGNYCVGTCRYRTHASNQQRGDLCGVKPYRPCRRRSLGRMLCADGRICGHEF